MLARGTAAEVHTRDEDGGVLEAFVVERVLGLLAGFGIEAHVMERELTEAVEGDAFHETGRDDAVGIDVSAGDENSGAGDLFDRFEGHFGKF